VPEAYVTAADALFERARWSAGEPLLITAAGSGVGIAAAQIAREGGGPVIGLSRTAAKRERIEAMGLARAFDPADPSLREKIRDAAGGGGAAVALDFVGAAGWPLLMDVMASLGRIVLIGTMSGARVEADLSRLMTRRLSVTGTMLRTRSREEKGAAVDLFARKVLPRIEAGEIRPVVDRIVPMAAAASAHEAMERNENFGKIVLQLSGESRLLT
jgi:NADPH:quinone reductase-like Zn-dependent oxidoreductase